MITIAILIPIQDREVSDVTLAALSYARSSVRAEHGIDYTLVTWAGNEELGKKLNAGLQSIRSRDFDYLMVLGSDDLLHPDAWRYIKEAIERKQFYFGFQSCYFYDQATHRAREWKRGGGAFAVGAGRCIHRRLVEQCSWVLWPDNLAKGLDNAQEGIIQKATGLPCDVIATPFPVVCDIKDGRNIHPFDDKKDKEADPDEVCRLFPALNKVRKHPPLWTQTTTNEPQGGGFDL